MAESADCTAISVPIRGASVPMKRVESWHPREKKHTIFCRDSLWKIHVWGFEWGAGPNWDDALFELPYQTYRYTGDVKVIKDNFTAMKIYLRYMETKKNEEGLFDYGLGDWAQPGSNFQFTTLTEITDSIKCVDMCDKVARMAKLIEDEAMVEYAQNLAKEIRAAIKKKYIKNGKILFFCHNKRSEQR